MELLKNIQHILPEVPYPSGDLTYKDHHELKHLNELIDLGKANPAVELLEQRKASIGPDSRGYHNLYLRNYRKSERSHADP